MLLPRRSLLILALTASSQIQAAECGREDIDHYLDRGFTPGQVLDLCRTEQTAPASERLAPPSEQQSADLSYLREVLDATAIHLDPTALSFSRELCVKYDRPNFAEQRKKACGKAHYRIGLQGMMIVDTQKQLLFWGRNAIVLEGPSKTQRYALGQAQLSPRDQRELQKELDQLPFEVPVHEGVSVKAVSQRLRGLAKD
jgi:hypothetical protein